MYQPICKNPSAGASEYIYCIYNIFLSDLTGRALQQKVSRVLRSTQWVAAERAVTGLDNRRHRSLKPVPAKATRKRRIKTMDGSKRYITASSEALGKDGLLQPFASRSA